MTLLLLLAMGTHAQVLDDDDFGFDLESDFDIEIPEEIVAPAATKQDDGREIEDRYSLMHRFVNANNQDTSFDISASQGWMKRGELIIVKNEKGEIKRVKITNDDAQKMEKHVASFQQYCENRERYQLGVQELGLVTSISACAYIENGLGDAIVFSLDHQGNIFSFAYQKSYTKYKKAPKKWITEGLVRKISEGPRPQFKFKSYDQFGKQKIDEKEIKKQQEEEQPWYSKYWWALLIGGFLFMQMLAPPPEEGQGAQGGAAPARAPTQGR